jgi:hypothetical protein
MRFAIARPKRIDGFDRRDDRINNSVEQFGQRSCGIGYLEVPFIQLGRVRGITPVPDNQTQDAWLDCWICPGLEITER